jgi:hypothetical protein
LQLETIKDFFGWAFNETGEAITAVDERQDRGEYQRLGDYHSALDPLIFRQEIAARAVFHELWSLVEGELQESAEEAWMLSKEYRKLKEKTSGKSLTQEDIKGIPLISDVSISRIVQMIESHYNVSLKKLPGAETVFKLRDTVNAFKHRKGYEDWRKLDHRMHIQLPERHRPTDDDIEHSIKHVGLFIKSLWKVTGREPAPFCPSNIDWDEEDDIL